MDIFNLVTQTNKEDWGEKEKEKEVEAEQQEEDEILLHGFSSESDSSDEESDGVDDAPVDLGKLPTIAKDDLTVQKKLERAKKQPVCFSHRVNISCLH